MREYFHLYVRESNLPLSMYPCLAIHDKNSLLISPHGEMKTMPCDAHHEVDWLATF